MSKRGVFKIIVFVLFFLGVWLIMRYLFPIILPFLLGGILALISEPGVKFLQKRLRLPRGAASGAVITLTLAGATVLIWLIFAVAYRELSTLAALVPGMMDRIGGAVARLRVWALGLVRQAPQGISEALERTVTDLFTSGNVLMDRAANLALGMAGSLVEGLPGGALLIGTAVISSYMISAQLPNLRRSLKQSSHWQLRVQPLLANLQEALAGWLKAQAKLSAMTFGIVLAGFWLLRTPNAILWALLTALVDAVPMLGTGVVLIPWAVVAFFQGETVRGVGLLGLYVTAMMTRSALEPKLVGHHLGLNPLVTLISLYAGYRIWGVPGMILSPILAVTANQLTRLGREDLR